MASEMFVHKIKNALRIDRAFLLVWRATKRWTIISIILTIIQGFLPLAILYLIKLIIDTIAESATTSHSTIDFKLVVYYIVAALLVMIAQSGVHQLLKYIEECQAAKVSNYVVGLIHKKSISLDLAYYENPEYYDTLHRAQQEGPYRPDSIVKGLTSLLQNGVSLVAMVGLLFLFHWIVGVVLLLSVMPGLFIQLKYAKKRYHWQNKRTEEERKADYFSYILTSDVFAKEIRLFGIGSYFSDLYDDLKQLLLSEKLNLSKQSIFSEFVAQIIAITFLIGSLFFIALRTFNGMITIGDMVMYFQAFQRGVNYLRGFLQNVASLHEDNLFISRLFAFLDLENLVTGSKNPEKPVAIPISRISFDNVEFSYPGERDPILKDISFSINRGETVALVGANGAGKSTIVKLLCRLYDPQKGMISFDNVSLRDIDPNDVRKRISVVFQDYAKYFLSVRENIWLGDTNIPQDSGKIKESAEIVNADSFIKKLPQGYDTQLGRWFSSGDELSIGEWQKIVLARAFLKDADLFILDEPTSYMDIETEYYLYTKFKDLVAGKSVLIISHRFSTVKRADCIYVLENGKILESGSHGVLLKKGGRYAELYKKQMMSNNSQVLPV